jgi:hypothetical protein
MIGKKLFMIGGTAMFFNPKKHGKLWWLITMIRNFGNIISSPGHIYKQNLSAIPKKLNLMYCPQIITVIVIILN